jgi:hypothetical protein
MPEPLRVVLVEVMFVAVEVVAVGGAGVVKESKPPRVFPALFSVIAQK